MSLVKVSGILSLKANRVNSIMANYRLDRNAFKGQTLEEAANQSGYYKTLTWQERLRVTAYLNSVAFNYPENQPPRLNKTKFKARSRIR
jgi:hypothetical protein